MDKTSAAYRRMDKTIINAFVELAQTMSFEKITVQKIVDAALISRYTFYTHFHDKYEVAERIENDLYREFMDFIREKIPEVDNRFTDSSTHWAEMDTLILEFQQKHAAQTRAIIDIHPETIDYSKRMKAFLMQNYKANFPHHENVDLEASIYAAMAMAISDYYKWNGHSVQINKNIISSDIYAFLYAIGVHDSKLIEKEHDRFMNMHYETKRYNP